MLRSYPLVSGSLAAAALVAATLTGCNRAPVAPVVQIGPEGARTGDDLALEFLTRSEDPDLSDTVTYDILWFQDGEPVEDLTGELTVPHPRTAKGEQWRAVVTPVDSAGVSGQPTEAAIIIANTAPTTSVSITPELPGSYEDLLVDTVGFDVDGDPVSHRFEWVLDGNVELEEESGQLPSSFTSKGEVWTVRAYPTDGEDEGEPARASATIGNVRPEGRSVVIEPPAAFTDDDLTAVPEGFDEDGDPLEWSYTWFINDEAVLGVDGPQLLAENHGRDDRVRVVATPNDGFVDGTEISSGITRIRNTAPEVSSALLDPTVVREADTITCQPGAGAWFDLDGDAEGYRFSWFVDGSEVSNASSLDGADFDRGDEVYCELIPFDGASEGTPARTETITVLNTLPTVAGATLDNTAPKAGDTISIVLSGIFDEDGDTVEFEYEWTVAGSVVSTDPSLPSSLFSRDDTITARVRPCDPVACGAWVDAGSATAVNTPPEVVDLTLSPTTVRTDDSITATAVTDDADGDPVTVDYTWYVDGVATGVVGDTITGADFDKDQEVYVEATPNDTTDDGPTVTSATLTILNTAPTLDSATIDPSSLSEEDVAECIPSGWEDADEDDEDYRYTWYVDGAVAGRGNTLDGDFFGRGDEVYCEIVPTDGDDDGTAVESGRIIVDNTLPTIDSVSLTNLAPVEGDTVAATIVGANDVDGDTITFDYEWFVGGSSVSTDSELDSSLFAKGQEIYVEVTPNDDVGAGDPVRSDTAEVANTPPEITAVTLAPTRPTTTDAVVATPTASDEDAADTVGFTYTWYVDGVVATSTDNTLDASEFDKNQTIYVVVTPNDGDEDGADFTSASIRSVNTAPTFTAVSITPSTGITESTTLTCSPTGWDDDDDDTEAYRYEWTIGGSTVGTGSPPTGAAFDKGDAVPCTATAFDGEDTGTRLTSAPVSVDNTPPELASVTLSTLTPTEGDTLTATLGAATDDDGDPITFAWSWSVGGSEVSTDTSLPSTEFDEGEEIILTVTPNDGTIDGDPVSSLTARVGNSPPEVTSVTLSPTDPTTDEDVVATATTDDPDGGDTVTVSWTWSVNGSVLTGVTGDTLDSSEFVRGDTIAVVATPNDSTVDGATGSAGPITVVNTVPSITSVDLTPVGFTEATGITCDPVGWSDADASDTPGYVYQWTVDGVVVSETGATLTGTFYDRGDEVVCTVTPDDGIDLGTAVSSAATEVANAAPTLASATITPASPTEGDTLAVTLGAATDPDGDGVTFDYSWRIGGSEVGTGATLPDSAFAKGNVVSVLVTPTDGTTPGAAVPAAGVTIQNSKPEVTSVSLSTTSPGTDDDITATWTATDADPGDVSGLTATFAWYVNGGLVSGETDDTLEGVDHFDKLDDVYVEVTVNDGTTDSDPVASATVEVVNDVPSIASASLDISPEPAAEGSIIECDDVGRTDDDPGDMVVDVYQWYVNGAASITGDTITDTHFDAGDTVYCQITPDDGDDQGTPVTSSTVTIRNSAPEVGAVTLSDAAPTTTDDLTASVSSASATDADGDPVTLVFDWFVNGTAVRSVRLSPSGGTTSDTLDSAEFVKDDVVRARVTPTDGLDDGTAQEATATVANTPPVITAVTISPATGSVTGTLIDLQATVTFTDADGDAPTPSWVWTVDDEGGGTTSTVDTGTSDTLADTNFDKADVIDVEVTLDDSGDIVTATADSTVTIANTPPTLTTVEINETEAFENDTLTVNLVVSDADADDGDTVTYSYDYEWRVGGTAIGVTDSSGTGVAGASAMDLDDGTTPEKFKRDDLVTIAVTPDDGDDEGAEVESAGLTISNTAPTFTGVTINPGTLETDSIASVTLVGSDIDEGDTLSIDTITWTVTDADTSATTTYSDMTLDGSTAFDKGDTVAVEVEATDGVATVGPQTASVVVADAAPRITGVTLSQADPGGADVDVTVSYAVDDPDPADAAPTETLQWFSATSASAAGSAISGATSATLPSLNFVRYDWVYVEITSGSTTVTSSRYQIPNVAPTAPTDVSVSPAEPVVSKDLSCTWTASTDDDGDSVSYNVVWIVDTVEQPAVVVSGGATSATLLASETAIGEEWSCRVEADDGEAANNLSDPETSTPVEILSTVGRLVSITADTFTMGCDPVDDVLSSMSACPADETPTRSVEITGDYLMAEAEVTQQQWSDLMGTSPSSFTGCGTDCPVESINWYEALELANAASAEEGYTECYVLTGCTGTLGGGTASTAYECTSVSLDSSLTSIYDCDGYRLPTEAEWELAARGGESFAFAGSNTVGDVAWYATNSSSATQPVCDKDTNGFGLCDMSGNVEEWVWDWYGTYPTVTGTDVDPEGPGSGTTRTIRGGDWSNTDEFVRVANRGDAGPDFRNDSVGVRLVRTAP